MNRERKPNEFYPSGDEYCEAFSNWLRGNFEGLTRDTINQMQCAFDAGIMWHRDKHQPVIDAAHQIMEAARPCVLNLLRLEDAASGEARS
jgi:hypothetical protein